MKRARGFLRVIALDRSGLGLVEVAVATGILGVVIAGVMGVMTNISRSTRSGTMISGANIIQQNIQNLLSQEALCPEVLKTSNGTAARFNIGTDTTEDSTMNNRLHTIQMPSGIVIAQAGGTTQGVLLERIRMRRTNVPALESPGVYRTPFEVQLIFQDNNPTAMRSLGAQEITRLLYVNIVTNGGPNGTHAVTRCNGASFSSDQACSATGGTFESGECRYGKLIAAQNIANKIMLSGQLPSGGIATDQLIHTEQNITADGTITAGGVITAANGIVSNGAFSQGGTAGNLRVDLTASHANNSGSAIQNYRGMTANWDTDAAYFGMIGQTADRRDTLIAFGDNIDDELLIAHKSFNNPISIMARFMARAYQPDGNIGLAGLTWTGDRNVAALEIPGALVFGRKTPIDSGTTEASLAAGYLTVAGDIELGSLKQNVTNIALYNRAYGAHMNMTGGRIHAFGPVSGSGNPQPGFFVHHRGNENASAALFQEPHSDPTLPGAGVLVVRDKKPNSTTDAPIRLRIDGENLGQPQTGDVLTAMGPGGNAQWQKPFSQIQQYWFDSNSAPFVDAMNGSDPVRRATVDLGSQWTFCAMSGTYILVERGWHKWAKVEKIGTNWQAFMEIRSGGQHVAYGFYCFR